VAGEAAAEAVRWALIAAYVVIVVTLWTLVIITQAWEGL
jgi:hypothetical protein